MWGGHRNGRIPLDRLEQVGAGALSGEMQYLHPAVAAAWRAYVEAVRAATGIRLSITSGYRSLARQQFLWDEYRAGRASLAARPGTSNHGWATAIDMANYWGVPTATRRRLGEAAGFSFTTGDRVAEPWHIEYVGSLTVATQQQFDALGQEIKNWVSGEEKEQSGKVNPYAGRNNSFVGINRRIDELEALLKAAQAASQAAETAAKEAVAAVAWINNGPGNPNSLEAIGEAVRAGNGMTDAQVEALATAVAAKTPRRITGTLS